MIFQISERLNTAVNRPAWTLKSSSGVTTALQHIVVHFFVLAFQIATGIVTGRILGPAGKGEQAAMILWPLVLSNAMIMGLPNSLIYNLKRHPEEKSQLVSAVLMLGGAFAAVAALIGIVFIPQLMRSYSADAIHSAQWFMLYTPVGVILLITIAALRAEDDFTSPSIFSFFTSFITLIVLCLLALVGMLTPLTAGLTYLLGILPGFCWIFMRLWRLFRPRLRNIRSSCQRLMRYGLRSYGIDLIGALSTQVGQVLVVSFLPPAAMGLYVVAYSLSRILDVFQYGIVTVLFPKAAARSIEEVVVMTGRAARVGAALFVTVGSALALLSPMLLRLLYGSEYMEAVTVLRILLIEMVLTSATSILVQAFMALGRPGTVTIFQGIGLGLSIPLMLVLIPRYGLVGAGLALLCSSLVRLILVLISYPLFLKVHPPALLLNLKDLYFLQQRLLKTE